MNQEERREHKRYKVFCSVYYNEYEPGVTRQQMARGELIDISLGGACVETPDELPEGQMLILEIDLIGWGFVMQQGGKSNLGSVNSCLRVCGKVAHVRKVTNRMYQVGMHFLSIREHDRYLLEQYLKSQAR